MTSSHRSIARPRGSVWTSFFCVAVLVSLPCLAPPAAEAIPLLGTYEWNAGQSISGTFTSNGTELTAWNMTVSTYTWTTGSTLDNNLLSFEQEVLSPIYHYLIIHWASDSSALFAARMHASSGDFTHINGIPPISFSRVASVPEPSSLLQLALGSGLLAGLGYVRRQRREAGLQIG
ncbi:MAG: PEP-CTERM sorting domain-containing protein [Nitrospira sp.]|nr:PEP-CTERM sorting domain-containing protein [Nitrospira sp.]MBH0181642.1 PEP-CTERM sorting domain-containing protein [Nitrospira sp.]MBH0184267.1 PEP-CTERM sorting domain-containing protein [Nitrospira sp.]